MTKMTKYFIEERLQNSISFIVTSNDWKVELSSRKYLCFHLVIFNQKYFLNITKVGVYLFILIYLKNSTSTQKNNKQFRYKIHTFSFLIEKLFYVIYLSLFVIVNYL